MNEESCTPRHLCNASPRPVKILIGSEQIDLACQCLLDQTHPRLSTTQAAIAKRLLDFVCAVPVREPALKALWMDVNHLYEANFPKE